MKRNPSDVALAINEQRYKVIQPIGALLSKPVTRDWIVEAMIEHGSLNMIFGESGAGKSFCALSIAAAVATGLDWFGHNVQAGPVVYVAGEGKTGIIQRLATWGLENGVDLSGTPLMVTNHAISFNESSEVDQLLGDIENMPVRPSLIVIDTLARASAGMDENCSRDMGQFVLTCDHIMRNYGCAIIIVHHTGHRDLNRARGSSALRAAIDVEIQVKFDRRKKIISFSCTKVRDGDEFSQLNFHLEKKRLPSEWNDSRGNPLISAVLKLVDSIDNDTIDLEPVTNSEKVFMETFQNSLNGSDSIQIDGKTLPCVDENVMRELCYKADISNSIKLDSKRKAYRRVADKLLADGRLAIYNGKYYKPVENRADSGQHQVI